MADLRLAIPIDGADFDSNSAEYQRNNTEVSLKASVDLLTGLVLHAKLNDNAGNTTVIDSSIYGNNGATNGTNTSSLSTTGLINQAFNFTNTTANRVGFANASQYNISNAFSVSTWIKVSSIDSGSIVSKDGYASNDGMNIYLSSSDSKIHFKGNGTGGNDFDIVSNSAISTNTWYHILAINTGSAQYLYINNVLQTATDNKTDNFMNISKYVCIGGNIGGVYDFLGLIDDTRIYNIELSSLKISALYNSGNGTEEAAGSYPTECFVNPLQVDSGSNSTTWDMSTFLTLVNPNGESGTVKFKYATGDTGNTIPDYADDNTAYSSTWLTLAQLQAETDPTAGCFRIVMQITGNGSQDGTVTDSSIVATITTTGGGEYSYTF